jgi:hypothetical protein
MRRQRQTPRQNSALAELPNLEPKEHALELETVNGEVFYRKSKTLPPAVEIPLLSAKVWTKPLQVVPVRSKFVQVDGCKYKEVEK